MTTPGGFEYTADSVIARLSVDVPPQALTDLDQIRQQTAGLRTEMEALARSQGDWLEYLKAIPQIADQANQSYRTLITAMERMSYVQREMGGGLPGGTEAGAAGKAYSTSAPAGYVDPFAGMTAGTGERSAQVNAAAYSDIMQGQDQRLHASMAAQRGINPAHLGLGVAGAEALHRGFFGGGSGQGGGPAASQSPQATQAGRDSSAPPEPTEGGVPSSGASQHTPSQPHPDAPLWQKAVNWAVGGKILGEVAASGRGVGGDDGGGMGALGGFGGAGTIGGDDDDGGGGGAAGMVRGMAGKVLAGSALQGKLGKLASIPGVKGALDAVPGWTKALGTAGLAVGGVIKGYNKIQDVAEVAQGYRDFGLIQGGGFGEGVGHELRARMSALDPFIDTATTRNMIQTTLSEGFRGDDANNMQAFMEQNYKKFAMSAADTMAIYNSSMLKGKEGTEEFNESLAKLGDSLQLMKDLTKQGGASFQDRLKQFAQTTDTLTSMGVSQDMASASALRVQEMYGDDKLLREHVPGVLGAGMQDNVAMYRLAQRHGLQGALPETVAMELSERGVDAESELNDLYKELALQAQSSHPRQDIIQQAAWWRRMMKGMYGVETGDMKTTLVWFRQLVGARDPGEYADERIDTAAGMPKGLSVSRSSATSGTTSASDDQFADQARSGTDPGSQSQRAVLATREAEKGKIPDTGGFVTAGGSSGIVTPFSAYGYGRDLATPDVSSLGWGREIGMQMQREMAASSVASTGRPPPPTGPVVDGNQGGRRPPEQFAAAPGPGGAVSTTGTVSGEVRISVDQAGRVSAPPTIQLTGTQRAVNMGYGGSQMNSPGTDSHAHNGWAGG